MSNSLPNGWIEVKLRDVAKASKGRKPAFLSPKLIDGLVPYLDVKALETGEIRQYADAESSRITDGTEVAVLWDGARSGWAFPAQKGALGSTLIALRSKAVDARFLLYLLRTHYKTISSATQGSGIPHIDPQVFWELSVPLPPLAEQLRIAAEIERSLNHLASQRQELELLPDKLKDFSQSILADAFSGKLTEQWRESNLQIEQADILIDKIKNSRINDSTKKLQIHTLQSFTEHNNEIKYGSLPDLKVPSSWRVCRLGVIADVMNGSTPSRRRPEFWNGTIPWLSSGELKKRRISSTRELITDQGFKETSVRLIPAGSVLIAMIGDGKTRGQCSILDISACINQNIAALVITHGLIDSDFLWMWLQYRYESIRTSGGGSGAQALNCQKVRDLAMVVPPLAEQKAIVQLVNDQLLAAESAAQEAFKIGKTLEVMTTETLARAFRGELIPQDPNDEPAEILLARIKAMPPDPKIKSSRRPIQSRKAMKQNAKSSPESLTSTLMVAGGRLNSTELFRLAGYDADSVDEFYEVLKKAVANGTIKEERPNRSESFLVAVPLTASSKI